MNFAFLTFHFSSNGFSHLEEALEQPRHLRERNHVRAIAHGLVRFGVRLDEKTVRASRERAARQQRGELALAGRAIAARACRAGTGGDPGAWGP